MLLDGQTVEKEVLTRWDNAITVIASVFPILFASVVGRMIYETARWKLEKGATLAILEQLIGSRTVGSALLTQINLCKFNLLGFGLLILWALSPLGSQSALRMLRTRLQPVLEPSQILHYATDAQSAFTRTLITSASGVDQSNALEAFLQTMYTALLLAPLSAKTSVMDTWGNVKIPRLEVDGSAGSSDGWYNVSRNPEPDSYSALVGFPVTNVSRGNVTFSLESSYIDLRCNQLKLSDDLADLPSFNWTHAGTTGSDEMKLRNGTWHGQRTGVLETQWAIAVDRFVDQRWNVHEHKAPTILQTPNIFENDTDLDVTPAKFLFSGSFRNSAAQYIPMVRVKATCDAVQQYVESRVTCSRIDPQSPQNCSVTAQRFSRKKNPPKGVTMVSFPDVWGWVTKGLPTATGKDQMYADSMIRYLDNPRLATLTMTNITDDDKLLKSLDEQQFGRRFSQLLNTYLLLGQLYTYAPQGSIDPKATFEPNVTVPVDVSNLVETYAVDWVWINIFFISSTMLFASGMVSVVFAHLAVGPEILGYASSIIRDSKYIDLPPETGRKEAIDVSKTLGEKRIKYGFTELISEEGQPLVGVGLEDHIQGIRISRPSKSDSGTD
ncbi:hypothetical protein NW762_009194 [Fusarium torreyae]|uniref:Uncharacterized protein n=1 Tax=Fusarium torreyae TaxID=1237075 RepID=A0A9W8RY09_9HYPO|nr:hypothetical protein NW762_009194 [Fusarium torreyae]